MPITFDEAKKRRENKKLNVVPDSEAVNKISYMIDNEMVFDGGKSPSELLVYSGEVRYIVVEGEVVRLNIFNQLCRSDIRDLLVKAYKAVNVQLTITRVDTSLSWLQRLVGAPEPRSYWSILAEKI